MSVYLVQPKELIGTNRFKIGCSESDTDSRLRSYKKGTRYLITIKCDNPFLLESKIKESFSKKYNLIAGHEYFEGDENELLIDFINITVSPIKESLESKKNPKKIIKRTIKYPEQELVTNEIIEIKPEKKIIIRKRLFQSAP